MFCTEIKSVNHSNNKIGIITLNKLYTVKSFITSIQNPSSTQQKQNTHPRKQKTKKESLFLTCSCLEDFPRSIVLCVLVIDLWHQTSQDYTMYGKT